MTNYNDGLWHGWNGGECPVHPRTLVGAATKYEGFISGFAGQFFWDDGIAAFRVIKEHKEPREFWMCGYTICTNENAANRVNVDKHDELMEIIHVREVLE